MLPKAAERVRKEIELGLEGNAEAVVKARTVLRALFGGQIKLEKGKKPGTLTALVFTHREALLGSIENGSGGRI